jgi:alpha-tubulin suppressor-like RCC1 family protein
LADSSIHCWGLNTSGELGIGNTANLGDDPAESGVAPPPVTLGAPSLGASSIAAGANHNCAVHVGVVKCWGAGRFGRLGTRGVDNPSDTAAAISAVDLGQ